MPLNKKISSRENRTSSAESKLGKPTSRKGGRGSGSVDPGQASGVQLRAAMRTIDEMLKLAESKMRKAKELQPAMTPRDYQEAYDPAQEARDELLRAQIMLRNPQATKNAQDVIDSVNDIIDYVKKLLSNVEKNLNTAKQAKSRERSQPDVEDTTNRGKSGTRASAVSKGRSGLGFYQYRKGR